MDTPSGPLALSARNLEPGTRLLLQLTGQVTPAADPTNAGRAAFEIRQAFITDHKWPALEQAIRQLADGAPAVSRQLIQTILPSPSHNLASNLFLFVTALRGGDMRSWLGDAPIRTLTQTNPQLLARLRDDFTQLSRIAAAQDPNDWRIQMTPFWGDGKLEQIRMLTRRQKGGKDENGELADPGTRFVVDVTLTRLGRIQLDGLVQISVKRLDILVRTDDFLPEPVQSDIRDLFYSAGDVTGFAGVVDFQAKPANFVEVSPPNPAEDGVGLMV